MYHNFRRASIIAIAMAVLVFGVAFATIYEFVILQDGYVVSYLGYEPHPSHPNVTTWTYAVTEPEEHINGGGLSHWTLGVCTSFKLKDPQLQIVDEYRTTTITNITECSDETFNCTEANYDVSFGNDGSTGVYGVKFTPVSDDDQLEGQTPQRTHVLQFNIYHPDGFQATPGDVVVKTGNGGLVGAITGPQCPPTAVSLASFGAATGQTPLNIGLIMMLAAGLLLLVGGGSYLIARRTA